MEHDNLISGLLFCLHFLSLWQLHYSPVQKRWTGQVFLDDEVQDLCSWRATNKKKNIL